MESRVPRWTEVQSATRTVWKHTGCLTLVADEPVGPGLALGVRSGGSRPSRQSPVDALRSSARFQRALPRRQRVRSELPPHHGRARPRGPAIRALTVDAGGNLTRSNDVVPQGGAATSPSLVLPTPSGWRVIRSCDHHRPRIRRASLRRSSRDSRTGHRATRGWRHRTDAVLRRLSHASSSSPRSRCRSHQSVGA